MTREWMLQCGVLYVPVVFTALLLACQRDRERRFVALLFSLTWQAAILPVLDRVCQMLGYWNYSAVSWAILAMPLAFHIGWVLWWGAVMPLLLEWLRLRCAPELARGVVLVIAIVFDLLLMPLLTPVLQLSAGWWRGESLLVLIALGPGLALFEMTRDARHPLCRGLMISFAFALLILWVLPFSTMDLWPVHSMGAWLVFAVALVLALVPGLWAVVLFGTVGRGTPIPFDPPQHLVTIGIYRWIANPMQVSILLSMLIVAVFFSHLGLGIAAVSTWAYSIGLARWSENIDLSQRFGDSWRDYRNQTASWWPRRSRHKSIDQ